MRRRGRRGLGSFLFVGVLILGTVLAGIALYAESRLADMVLGGLGQSFSTRVYCAPYVLGPASAPPPERLMRRLQRLGYRKTLASAPLGPGEFSWEPFTLRVAVRGFKTPQLSQEPGEFRLSWGGEAWTVSDSTGGAVAQVALEPELATELSGPQKIRREPAQAEEIPDILKKAVVAAEDRRFYQHRGVDARAIARALASNLRGRGAMQGGSTITQQLAKNLFLHPRRTIRRKLSEMALSVYLELRFGKERILAMYLNHIYLGQEGAVSVAGVKAAADHYFGKAMPELTISECAMLAGLIRSPHRYNPLREPAAARARRDFVLKTMREQGMIRGLELDHALAERLRLRERKSKKQRTGNEYFVSEVIRRLVPRYGEETLFRHGLSIHTTMDPLLQAEAQASLRHTKHQGALVAMDQTDGAVLALAGGKDYAESQFNRATQARRQPGSAFKPFVFGAALERGFTPATILEDKRKRFPRGGEKTWAPENYEGVYHGTATLRKALAFSLNAATLDLGQKTGTQNVVAFARKLGVESPLEASLATALGASEVTLLELVAAYAPFANGGFKVSPRFVTGVTDAEGTVLEFARIQRDPVISPALAALMTSLLQTVTTEGTARRLPALGFERPCAGKTGTTNDGRDAWFVGYTPALLSGAWIGDDQHRPISATGAKDALPVWAAFMKAASAEHPDSDFAQSTELVAATIDPESGLRARSGCPTRREELFLAGTQPSQDCQLHAGGFIGWLKGFFRRKQ